VTSNDDYDDLNTEDEIEEEPYVEFDLSISPSDPTLELFTQQIDRGDIIIPFYQRKYVWKLEQASRLIESFLMGLPIPQVFLYVNSEDRLEVIDGQQRLMSVKYFFEGFFGEEDKHGRRQVFKLKGLSERSEYNGKTFADLPPKDQRRLKNSTLRAINIKQLKPRAGNESVFHIFQRLNTGGTQLKPQEIRNAVYRGQIVRELAKMNANPGWKSILGIARDDKNQKDVELILRLLSLYGVWEDYEKPMLQYLNKSMDKEREFSSLRVAEFRQRFPQVVELVNEALEKPFRPRRVINAAVLEAVMIILLENPTITRDRLSENYEKLFLDADFVAAITGGTTDTGVLKQRLRIARRVLLNGAS